MNQSYPTKTNPTHKTKDTMSTKWAVWRAQPTTEIAAETFDLTSTSYAGGEFRQTIRRFMRMRASVACLCAVRFV